MPNSSKLLSNINRTRHAVSVAGIMPEKIPLKYQPIQRTGTSRTADGAVFVLRDPSKVGKIVFFNNDRKRRQIMNEFRIGKRMGEIGVGPRVYEYFKIKKIDISKLPRNLLSKEGDLHRNAIFIIMQNLGYGVKKIETLSEYVRAGNPYPYGQMKSIYERMVHRHGMKNMMLLHGNLHMGNIIVRTFMNDKKRLYFIDFGRSIYLPYEGDTRETLLSSGHRPYAKYPGYYISPKSGRPRGINTEIIMRNIRKYKVKPRGVMKNSPKTYKLKKNERTRKRTISLTSPFIARLFKTPTKISFK